MNELDLLGAAAAGMDIQRGLLDIAARNVAAAQASTPSHPYPRLVARFAQAADVDAESPDDDGAATSMLRIAGTVPSGETADAMTEMLAVLDAQRAYEAHASVFDVGKRLAERTLDIGRT